MLPVAKSNTPLAAGLLNPSASTDSSWPERLCRTLPVSICTTFVPASSEPVTTMGDSGCAQIETMPPSCTPRMCCCGVPVRGFHTMTLLSSDAVTTSLPPRPQQPQETLCAWPAKICINLPVGAHHIQAIVSAEPARMAWPFGCQLIHSTSLEGPSKACCNAPEAGSQMRTVPSYEPVAAYLPSWLKATCVTESVWPVRRKRSDILMPVDVSSTPHRTALSSWPPVRMMRLSAGQTATERTLSWCATHARASSTSGRASSA
mmetsp:Transcript_41715/g.108031  ORF Transcript_41715/g.108031 Transcript_41715/m.108031 type:complete len:261 (+) Transcript_41715:568-1350(+)